jgi:hypothetical protein
MKIIVTSILVLGNLCVFGQNPLLDSSFSPKPQQKSTAPSVGTQEGAKKFDPSRLVFGGNLGANFGDLTFINISPQVGYAFKPWLTAGAGINFIHNSFKYRVGGTELYRDNFTYAGLNVFGRVFPIKFIMLSAQPELNYSWGKRKYKTGGLEDVKLEAQAVPVLLLGAGLVVPTGGRGGIMVSLQYDVVQNALSPYGRQAFVNVGFTF